MTTENTKTKIEKVFTFSCYEHGSHRTTGWLDGGEASFAETLSPLHIMIEAFRFRPLGTKIKITMEEIN